MDGKLLTAPFDKIGARAKAAVVPMLGGDRLVRLDIRTDAHGEFYELLVLPHVSLRAVDVRPDMRHLLLLAHDPVKDEKHKFLCGHDERHWFVAGVPDAKTARGVSNVRTAMEALKPPGVRRLQDRFGVKFNERTSRHTDAYIRQGEWFFVKAPASQAKWFSSQMTVIRKKEPLSRGAGSKPHIAEFALRSGGEVVHVSNRFPTGLTETQYREAIKQDASLLKARWIISRRNPEVYVRGTIRHPDHATIHLDGWHQVLMNEEGKAPAMRHIAFID